MAKIVDGKEVLDSTPVEVPLHWKRPPSLRDQIKQYVRSELSSQASEEGFDSFEEADDFEVDEDPDPLSAYELKEAQEEVPSIIQKKNQEAPQETKSGELPVTPVKPAAKPEGRPNGQEQAE